MREDEHWGAQGRRKCRADGVSLRCTIDVLPLLRQIQIAFPTAHLLALDSGVEHQSSFVDDAPIPISAAGVFEEDSFGELSDHHRDGRLQSRTLLNLTSVVDSSLVKTNTKKNSIVF